MSEFKYLQSAVKNNTVFMKIKVYNITIIFYTLLYGCENWLLKIKGGIYIQELPVEEKYSSKEF
jgi:hypothetical protein